MVNFNSFYCNFWLDPTIVPSYTQPKCPSPIGRSKDALNFWELSLVNSIKVSGTILVSSL